MEIFNLDVDRLRQIREDLDVLYTEDEDCLGEGVGSPETWMQFAAEAPDIKYADVPDALSLEMYLNTNWVHM